MSDGKCQKTLDLETRPDVVRWMRRLELLAKAMPSDIRVYVAGGTVTVMDDCNEGSDGDTHQRQRHALDTPACRGRWDGGDW